MIRPDDSAERVRALLAFFRETHYDVAMPEGGIVALRTGQLPAAAIARWIGGGAAIYMTACNPYSQAMSRDENARRQAALRSDLDTLGARVLDGTGHIPGERWREPSFLVAGLDLAAVDALARAYEQNALLVVEPGKPVRMRIYRPEWRAAAGTAADVEWAPAVR